MSDDIEPSSVSGESVSFPFSSYAPILFYFNLEQQHATLPLVTMSDLVCENDEMTKPSTCSSSLLSPVTAIATTPTTTPTTSTTTTTTALATIEPDLDSLTMPTPSYEYQYSVPMSDMSLLGDSEVSLNNNNNNNNTASQTNLHHSGSRSRLPPLPMPTIPSSSSSSSRSTSLHPMHVSATPMSAMNRDIQGKLHRPSVGSLGGSRRITPNHQSKRRQQQQQQQQQQRRGETNDGNKINLNIFKRH